MEIQEIERMSERESERQRERKKDGGENINLPLTSFNLQRNLQEVSRHLADLFFRYVIYTGDATNSHPYDDHVITVSWKQ